LVQAYALLAIPLAAFYQYIFSLEFKVRFFVPLVKCTTVLLLAGFLWLNIFQTNQYDHPFERKLLHYDSMSKAAYWRIFAKPTLSDAEYEKYLHELSPADYDGAKKGKRDN
ncbi:MAG TPA: hypothetical protein VNX01_08140, partial [Bacteroidia bacterium]|nr:hypothetical protein [Bacteroidia bacterium]